jgi:hypothetical protein
MHYWLEVSWFRCLVLDGINVRIKGEGGGDKEINNILAFCCQQW